MLTTTKIHAQNALPTNNTNTFWNADMQAIAKPESKPGWVYFKDNFNTPVTDIFTTHAAAFGLSSDDSMALVKTKTDDLGIEHYWFDHYYMGYKVELDQLVLHKKNSRTYLSNGSLSSSIGFSPNNSLDTSVVKQSISLLLGVAVNSINFENSVYFKDENNQMSFNYKYYVLNNYLEGYVYYNVATDTITKFLNEQSHYTELEHASYYPGQLCLSDSVSHVEIEIDTTSYGVGGVTYYEYDTSNVYYFVDSLRGNGIYIYLRKKVFPNGQLFYFDTKLASVKIPIDELHPCENLVLVDDEHAAQNAYFTSQNVYDFLSENYNIQNLMGNQPMYLVMGTSSQPMVSSFGILGSVGISSRGVKIQWRSHSIAIVAHEWGHALDRNYGANLIPLGESELLSEGFADIFGLTIQFYMNNKHNLGISDPAWRGNTTLGVDQKIKRSLANPKGSGTFYDGLGLRLPHPDYYKGENWHGNGFQYQVGLPHHNSTVFSHWYYLISEGGTKTNEVGDTYQLDGMGLDDAFGLLMHAVTNYVIATADFLEMRRATIQATIDAYGYCDKLKTVVDAWDAVGVYDPQFNGFISPNIYMDYEVNSNLNINNDTIHIIGKLFVNNSTLNINSSHVTISPFSTIEVNSNSNLNINGTSFNCGLYSAIDIEEGGNFSSIMSNYQFDSTICFTVPVDTFYNLWRGINFSGGNNTTFNFIRNIVNGSFCGVLAKNSASHNPNFLVSGNTFQKNFKALYIKGNPSVNSGNIKTINENFFDFPWSKQTTLLPNIPSQFPNYYDDVLMNGHYVSLENIYNTEVNSNTFGNQNTPNFGAQTLPPNFNPSINVNGTSNTSNGLGLVNKNLGIRLRSNSSNILYNLHDNKFYKTSYSIHVDCISETKILKNKFIKERLGDSYGPFITSVGAGGVHIDSCIFQDSKFGVRLIGGSNNLLENNTFNRIHQNIYLTSGGDNVIKKNIFTNMLNSNAFEGFAIHNYGSPRSLIEGNTINGNAPYGIIMDNTGADASYIYDNTFSSTLSYAVQTDEVNSGLKIKCNKFAADGTPHHVAGIFVIDGSLADQGKNCWQGNNYQAGNEFIDNLPTATNPPKYDILLGQNASPFNYWTHKENQLYTPINDNTVPQKLSAINPNVIICNGLNGQGNQVKDQNSCTDVLDGWKISPPTDGGAVSAGVLTNIIELTSIRTNYLVELNSLEGLLFEPESQHDVVDKISYYQKELQGVNNKLLDIYKETDNEQAAQNLLEGEETIEAKMKLYKSYLEEKDFNNAARVLSEMNNLQQSDYLFDNADAAQNYALNKDYFMQIAQIEQSALQADKSLYELDGADLATLSTISKANLPISAKAEVLLAYNGDRLYQHPIKKLTQDALDTLLYQIDNSFDYKLSLTPNPASSQVEVCFVLPENAMQVKLKLIDEYNQVGLLLDEKEINNNELCKTFTVRDYTNGTYSVVLEHDGAMAASKHLLIAR